MIAPDRMKKIALLLFCTSVLLTACKEGKKNTEVKPEPEKVLNTIAFDADSAFSFVKSQTDFGPRVPNTEAHTRCGAYLISKMESYCDRVIVQPFRAVAYDGTLLQGKNIIASIGLHKEKRVLLGGHWDSRHIADYDPDPANRKLPIDGANDGASAIGVLMEVARQMQIKEPEIGVDIIFFDAEDYGTPNSENIPGDWWCLGSQYWSRNKHESGYTANYGILLDMVGAGNATFYREAFSSHYAPGVLSAVWGMANRMGYGGYFINERANPITDDHYYVNTIAKIPMINIIHQDKQSNTGFYPYWHTLNDDISNIDRNTLAVVGKVLLALIYDEK